MNMNNDPKNSQKDNVGVSDDASVKSPSVGGRSLLLGLMLPAAAFGQDIAAVASNTTSSGIGRLPASGALNVTITPADRVDSIAKPLIDLRANYVAGLEKVKSILELDAKVGGGANINGHIALVSSEIERPGSQNFNGVPLVNFGDGRTIRLSDVQASYKRSFGNLAGSVVQLKNMGKQAIIAGDLQLQQKIDGTLASLGMVAEPTQAPVAGGKKPSLGNGVASGKPAQTAEVVRLDAGEIVGKTLKTRGYTFHFVTDRVAMVEFKGAKEQKEFLVTPDADRPGMLRLRPVAGGSHLVLSRMPGSVEKFKVQSLTATGKLVDVCEPELALK